MRFTPKFLAASATAVALLAMPLAHAAPESDDLIFADFVAMCDTDKDGMVSKAEMMKMAEKIYDRHDSKKAGKLDKKQAEAFLRELMKGGGA